MHIHAIARLVLLITAALCTPLTQAGERWYVLEMQGDRAGWTVERERTEDGRIISTAESSLTIRRGTTNVTMTMSSEFIETGSGQPLEMSARTNLGGAPSNDRWIFNPDGVHWTSSTGDQRIERTLPLPEGTWLPPAAAGRYIAARLAAGAEEITVRSIDPLNGLDPIVTTRSAFAPEIIEVLGRDIEAIRCESSSSIYPDTVGIEHIDDQGQLLRSELNMGAMTITVIAADKELATSDLDPPELMASLAVSPNRPIPNAYTRSAATYTVRATTGTLPDIPSAGSQTAERLDKTTVLVTRATDPSNTLDPGDPADPAFTQSSAMITCDDPRIVELTRAALRNAPRSSGDRSIAERAETLRRAAHRHIRSKDLSVGFASASETARTREGDCTEHAVLLAAMLRADGIPSRVVSGLIYADRFAGERNIFAYHMWTQALLPLKTNSTDDDTQPTHHWVDLDATLPDTLPITATHIALGLHALEGDTRTNALVQLAPLMGRLAIDIESVD